MNVTILMLVLSAIGLLFLYFLRKNNENRKENLNIVKEGERLHFFLTDDHFFSIKLGKNSLITNDITKSISNRIESIRENIRKVSFVNFKDEILKKRLNRMLKPKKV